MFKWVLGLCASMYLTLLIFGAPPEEMAEVTPEALVIEAQAVEAERVEPAAVAEEAGPVAQPVITARTDTPAPSVVAPPVAVATLTPVVPVAATPEPVEIKPEPAVVVETPQVQTATATRIWTVTGSTVNLRDLPGTNGAVIGQTRRGNSAEVIEILDNGWARVFILESGLEAYMSADYLSAQQS